MAVRDRRQALVASIAEARVGALAELTRGRSREGAVEGIDLGQQPDVGIGIATEERLGGFASPITDPAGVEELSDQAGHLGSGKATDLLEMASKWAFVGLAQAVVPESPQLACDPVVEILSGGHIEAERLRAFEEGADLLQGLESLGLDNTNNDIKKIHYG